MQALKPTTYYGARGTGQWSDRALPRHPLPIGKLRGLPPAVRITLKSRRITTCEQLLRAAGDADQRDRLARGTGLDPNILLELVQRADMARVHGIGAMFGLMLEELGIRDIQTLASRSPAELHAALRDHNRHERIARRSPTPEEVAGWVAEARQLVPLVTYPG